MYNKKAGKVDLGKFKKPNAYKKDLIVDPQGQWKHPGQNTRIPGNDITMQGVPYPVWAQPNIGAPQMMYPGQDYKFPGADYVDEFPQTAAEGGEYYDDELTDKEIEELKRGGYIVEDLPTAQIGLIQNPYKKGGMVDIPKKKGSKSYSRSLLATNQLFTQNPLLKKSKSKKRKVFDPNAKYYQDGGPYNTSGPANNLEEQQYDDNAMNAVMKARLAYAHMHGNPSAKRMVNAPDQPYIYTGNEYDKDWGRPVGTPEGSVGTHYMAAFGNYAVPFIQQGPNGLFFNELPSTKDRETIRFDSPEDAQYFSEGYIDDEGNAHGYKKIAPDPSYRGYAKGGFQDDINTRRKLLRDWTYGQSIGMLQKQGGGDISIPKLTKAQEGYENKPAGKIDGEDYYNAMTMANRDLQEVKVTPGELPVGHWLKYKREYMKLNPYEDFAKERRGRYMRRTNKGLNEIYGVSEENFPKKAERRIKNAYEQAMDTYIFQRMGQDLGFDPKKREEWVDQVTDPGFVKTPEGQKVLEIISKSKYGHKLDPTVGSKFLSGLQQSANVLLPKKYELEYDIPGYTQLENAEAKKKISEVLNVLEPTSMLGTYFANLAYGQDEIAGTEGRYIPDILSGQLNPEVNPLATIVLDPMMVNPYSYMAGAKSLSKLAKPLNKIGTLAEPITKPIVKALDAPIYTSKTSKLIQRGLGISSSKVDAKAKLMKMKTPRLAKAAELLTTANVLKGYTAAATGAALPQVYDRVTNEIDIITNQNSTQGDMEQAAANITNDLLVTAVGLLPTANLAHPFVGEKLRNIIATANKAYASTPSTVLSLESNLNRLAESDPEGLRALFNTARLVSTKRDGGDIREIDNKTRRILAKLGYQIEDIN